MKLAGEGKEEAQQVPQQASGWDNVYEDDLRGLEDVEEHAPSEDNVETADPPIPEENLTASKLAAATLAPTPTSALMTSGWDDDDLDLSGLPDTPAVAPATPSLDLGPPMDLSSAPIMDLGPPVNLSQSPFMPPPPDYSIPLKGDGENSNNIAEETVVDHVPAQEDNDERDRNHPYNRNVSFEASMQVLGGDTGTSVATLESSAQAVPGASELNQQQMSSMTTMASSLAPTLTVATDNAVGTTTTSDGWQDEDDLDLGDDEVGVLSQQPVVDHTPTTPSPEDTGGNVPVVDHTPPSVSNVMRSLATESAVAATTTTQSSGWDTDVELSEIEKVVDHTPFPSSTGQHNTTTFATDSALPPASSDGWGDDENGLDLDIPDEEPSAQLVDHTPPPPPTPIRNNSTAAVLSSAEWEDDGEVEAVGPVVIDEEYEAVPVVDHTPPPPVAHREGASIAAVATKSEAVGWDEEDELSEGSDSKATSSDDDGKPLVDHIPPPPPPPRFDRKTTSDAIASRESEFDEGDDQSQSDTLSQADTLSITNSQRATTSAVPPPRQERWGFDDELTIDEVNVVDHTPVAAMEGRDFRRSETGDATASGMSVGSSIDGSFRASREASYENVVDQTPQSRLHRAETSDAVATNLSVGSIGSDARTGGSQEARVVDHTPSIGSSGRNASVGEASMAVLGAEASIGESTLESVGESSNRSGAFRPKSVLKTKMVDQTPSSTRSGRFSVDASLLATGAMSVGESLNSIEEEGEELESDTESANNAEGEKKYSITFQKSMVIPYGLTSPPAERYNPTEVDTFDRERLDQIPLVDHTPTVALTKVTSIANSVDVLSQSSEEDDLGGSTADGTIQDSLYGQVVDQIPEHEQHILNENDKPTGRAEDDTVLGVASKKCLDNDIEEDDAMDSDESSHGTSTLGASAVGEFETPSLMGSLRLHIVDEKEHLVDHIPEGTSKGPKRTDVSTMALPDEESDSSRVDDNIVNDDETTPSGFGPIVDHTPNVSQSRSALSVATSVATQGTDLEEDIKVDDDFDNTVVAGASVEEEASGWDNDEDMFDEVADQTTDLHLVDHIPRSDRQNARGDASTKVVVDAPDDTSQIDTIIEDSPANFGPIVDQLPLGPHSRAQSVAASVMTQTSGLDVDIKEDEEMDVGTLQGVNEAGPGWENDDVDLDDISAAAASEAGVPVTDEPHVVDHVPTESHRKPKDASTIVLVDQNDDASNVLDEPTARDGRFGPVVDQTPAPRSNPHSLATSMASHASDINADIQEDEELEDGTWFGTSTANGPPSDGASHGSGSDHSSGGWKDEEIRLNDLGNSVTENDLVDHIPPFTTPRATDASLAVVIDPSVVSSQKKEDNEDKNIDAGSFGDVVDQTPSISMSRQASASAASTATSGVANDLRKSDNMEVDSDIESPGENENGWGEDEAELEALENDDDDDLPPLVDHVPERPESRPTDASTFVNAEPSEMESQVDDFNQDEQNYGPVVDQTPPSQLALPHSATGSTVAEPPSVLDEDLDDAVETAGETDGEEQNGWDNDMFVIDEIPNPQSGNDEAIRREQLVDYVPPEEEEESVPEIVRDGSSEVATVGGVSALPNDEAKEDDFGPVVDHTPIGGSSPLSPRRSRRDDGARRNDSSMSNIRTEDSVGAIFSQASEEIKDDGLDENEFGPVVDHLPASSSKISITPSRGGSTVDALGTVSEVGADDDDDDVVTGEGWDDDINITVDDIDVAPLASTDVVASSSVSNDDKNLSVKWVDSLGTEEAASPFEKTRDGSIQSLGNNDSTSAYFDADGGETSNLSLNATKYYDPESGDSNAWDDSLILEEDDDATPRSTSRSNSSFPQGEDGNTKETREGEGAGSKDQASEGGCAACTGSFSTDCPCIQKLLQANSEKGAINGSLQTPEGGKVNINVEKLLHDEITKRMLLEKELDALRSANAILSSTKDTRTPMSCTHDLEIEQMKSENDDMRKKISNLQDELSVERKNAKSQELEPHKQELLATISQLEDSNRALSSKLDELDSECNDLVKLNEEVNRTLAEKDKSLVQVQQDFASLQARELALTTELDHLRDSVAQSSTTSSEVEKQVVSLQSELASKSGECANLTSQMDSMKQRLQVAESQNFQHTKELAKLSKNNDARLNELGAQLKDAQEQYNRIARQNEEMELRYASELSQRTSTIEKLQEEKDFLVQESSRLSSENQEISETLSASMRQKTEELEVMKTTLIAMQKENEDLSERLSAYSSNEDRVLSLESEIKNIRQERDVLQEALVESKATIVSLQNNLNSKSNVDVSVLESLSGDLDRARQQIRDLTDNISVLEAEKVNAAAGLAELKSLKEENEKLNEHVFELNKERDGLVSRAEQSSMGHDELDTVLSQLREQKNMLEQEKAMLEEDNEEMLVQFGLLKEQMDENERYLREAQDNLQTSESSCEALRNALAVAESRLRDIGNTAFPATDNRSTTSNEELARLIKEKSSLEERIHEIELEKSSMTAKAAQVEAQHEDLLSIIDDLKSQLSEQTESRRVEEEEFRMNLDLKETQLLEIQEELLGRYATVQDLNEQLNDAQSRIEDLELGKLLEVETDVVEDITSNETIQKLTEENRNLQDRIRSQEIEMSQMGERLREIQTDDQGMVNLVEELKAQLAHQVDANQARESELVDVIEDLEVQRRKLEETCEGQSHDIDRLHERLKEAQITAESSSSLNDRIDVLESELSEQQIILEQKETAIQDLNNQINEDGGDPQVNAELELLRKTVHEMEVAAVDARERIAQLEDLYQQKDDQLSDTMARLAELNGIEMEIETRIHDARASLEYRVGDLEAQLTAKEEEVRVFQEESDSLREQILSLELDLDSARNIAQPTSEPSGQAQAEIQNLRSQVQSLHQEQDAIHAEARRREDQFASEISTLNASIGQKDTEILELEKLKTSALAEASEREGRFELQVHGLHEAIAKKDTQIAALQQELRQLSSQFAVSKKELEEKQRELNRMELELEDLKSRVGKPATEQVLQSTKLEAESTEKMRTHIVSLAQALEQSESRRADAIERLEKERHANAESLKRLTESVKRFYSTLSFGEV